MKYMKEPLFPILSAAKVARSVFWYFRVQSSVLFMYFMAFMVK